MKQQNRKVEIVSDNKQRDVTFQVDNVPLELFCNLAEKCKNEKCEQYHPSWATKICVANLKGICKLKKKHQKHISPEAVVFEVDTDESVDYFTNKPYKVPSKPLQQIPKKNQKEEEKIKKSGFNKDTNQIQEVDKNKEESFILVNEQLKKNKYYYGEFLIDKEEDQYKRLVIHKDYFQKNQEKFDKIYKWLQMIEDLLEPLQGPCKECSKPVNYRKFDNEKLVMTSDLPFCDVHIKSIKYLVQKEIDLDKYDAFYSRREKDRKQEIEIFNQIKPHLKYLNEVDIPNLKGWVNWIKQFVDVQFQNCSICNKEIKVTPNNQIEYQGKLYYHCNLNCKLSIKAKIKKEKQLEETKTKIELKKSKVNQIKNKEDEGEQQFGELDPQEDYQRQQREKHRQDIISNEFQEQEQSLMNFYDLGFDSIPDCIRALENNYLDAFYALEELQNKETFDYLKMKFPARYKASIQQIVQT